MSVFFIKATGVCLSYFWHILLNLSLIMNVYETVKKIFKKLKYFKTLKLLSVLFLFFAP